MKRIFLLFIMVGSLFVSCSKESSEEVAWNSNDLSRTLWEGKIVLAGVESFIVISFDSGIEGSCFSNSSKDESCLFEYSMVNKEVRFYNVYGDSDKLVINGLWHFLISEKNKIKLIRFDSEEERNYIILTRIINN
ncbi:hypothetical protein [Bacteroides sp. GM023]|uniref:hypothetical protein n=1 Tax=Bacteroides sp. GM023 TaxID=2723058 RepID=UPI00168B66AA|nr:hypothetical protein [Bacteroides sp. GM023]MBD3592524.1 hypothetical protein [Bacteroides sp. GM023]